MEAMATAALGTANLDTREGGVVVSAAPLFSLSALLAAEDLDRPVLACVGGGSAESAALAEALLDSVDECILGGALALAFKGEWGVDIGGSVIAPEVAAAVPRLVKKARTNGVRLHLPSDYVTGVGAAGGDAQSSGAATDMSGIDGGLQGLDIG